MVYQTCPSIFTKRTLLRWRYRYIDIHAFIDIYIQIYMHTLHYHTITVHCIAVQKTVYCIALRYITILSLHYSTLHDSAWAHWYEKNFQILLLRNPHEILIFANPKLQKSHPAVVCSAVHSEMSHGCKNDGKMDWFEGSFRGNPHISWEKQSFPLNVALKQCISIPIVESSGTCAAAQRC